MTRKQRYFNRIMSTGEVARFFGVDRRTVYDWCVRGMIPHFRTPTGHRRFYREDCVRLREAMVS